LVNTYAKASAGRFTPIPELDDEVEGAKLICCNGFLRGKKAQQ